MASYVDPYAVSRGFNNMVQLGQQRRQFEAQEQQRGIENQRSQEQLGMQREQMGMQKQRFGLEQQDAQMKGREWLGTYAARAKQATDPQIRRGIMREALQLAAPQKLAEFDALPDEQLAQQIEQFAAFAPTKPNMPANVQEWEYYNSLPQEKKQAYLEMKRAQQTFLPTIANVPTVVRPGVAGGATQTQPLTNIGAVAGNAATVAGAETTAKETAKGAVEAQQVQQQNKRAFDTYQAAMTGLSTSLANTQTGPISGRMPAVTASQQTAEGAVAAIAPVLKQLFRSTGEGTFTDRDQELLLDMVPKRTDHPEARAAKMQMIDQLVAAKLGMPGVSPRGPNAASPTPSRPQSAAPITATGPNGQKLILQNGQWVPHGG
jgi:hypothetical protein